MQVVILAGGKGIRLRPLTYKIPKPMIAIHDKPFLQYQLEFIKSFGLNEVVLLVGYLVNQIREYFGGGAKFGLKIEYSCEDTPLGTAGSLRNAGDKLGEEFLLLNSDTFLPIDYDELIKYFCQSNKAGIITAYNNFDKIAPNNTTIGKSNLVIDYNKEDSKGMTHLDAGVMVFKKGILDIIPNAQVCSLEETVYDYLIKTKQLSAFITNQRFYDMGSFENLKLMGEILQ